MLVAEARSPLVNRRYLVLDALGRGGMGRVFRAFDRATERMVAIKTPHDHRGTGPDHPMVEEFRVWSCLAHPNIVRIIDLERSRRGPLPRDTPFLVLERAPGMPAHRALVPGRSGFRTLRAFARDALQALVHVHAADVVHRDLKPGNFLVTRRPRGGVRVQLTDFGLAAARGTRDEAGCISGSLPYVAPESILGGTVDGRTDLYGLGILLSFLSTGALPFSETEPEEILRWHLDGTTPDPCTTRPDLPASWGRFVRRLAQRAPADRPRSAHRALSMLGCGSVERNTHPPRIAEIATLRLAIDAVRIGGVRVHDLPGGALGRAVLGQARSIARTLDVGLVAVDGTGAPGSAPDLPRALTNLLASDFEDLAAVIRRHHLEGGLPIELLGGIAVWDRAGRSRAALDPAARRATARGVVAVLLDAARRRPRIVSFGRSSFSDPLVRDVVKRLEDNARTCPAPRAGAPALLVLRPPDCTPCDAVDRGISRHHRRKLPQRPVNSDSPSS
jgi:hypothetical protein